MAKQQKHPADAFLHLKNLPTIWCPGCGIGIVVNTFIQTVNKMNLKKGNIFNITSGISCTGKISDHLNLKSTISEDPFQKAYELKKKNPQSRMVIFFNDNDLMVNGIDSLLKSCHAEAEILAIYINSFVCNILFFHKKFMHFNFRKQDSHVQSKAVFNLPLLMKDCGASYIARWTPLHCRRLAYSIKETLLKPGFSFIEVISPCLMYYASSGYEGKTIDRMGYYLKNAKIENDHPMEDLQTENLNNIIIGNFLNKTQ
jgi:2-oxoglutarate ferredoxin oxidoreductase subunit beta